jgi:PAS domain S-box-containing protein
MQLFDFSSARFVENFPYCADGAVCHKYYQLLQQLFPEHAMFIILLNDGGDLFLDMKFSSYEFVKPDALIDQFINGAEILLTDQLVKKPFQGIFSAVSEQMIKFFMCCRITSANGRFMGCFGVMSSKAKTVLPDEKIFMQWLAESMSTDISGNENELLHQQNSGQIQLQQEILPYLDDIYLIVERDGNILSLAQQLPKVLEQLLNDQGRSLSCVFSQENSRSLIDLVQRCALSNKKKTDILNIKNKRRQFLFSVSCNLFNQTSYILTFHDVTERYRLRDILDERRHILESIINVGSVGVLLLDEQGDISYCNNRVLQWFDIKSATKNIRLPAEYWADNKFGESPFKKIFSTGQDLKDVRYACFIGTGELKTFSVNGVVNHSAKTGKATGTFFLQDVTERALLEQVMMEMEQQMQFLLNSSPVIIYQMISMPFHQYTYISPNCEAILGLSQHDILNEGLFWQQHIHPDDKACAMKAGVIDTVQVVEYRFWLEQRGEYRWLKDIRRMTNEDETNCWIGALHDVTELKAAEQHRLALQEEIAATLASLADAVITLDRDGLIQDLNPATCRMFGYQRQQLLHQPISSLLSAEILDYLRQASSAPQPQAERQLSTSYEIKALHANGDDFPVALSLAVIGEQEQLRFVGCCHDLSQIKKQQEQLLHSEKLGAVGKLTSSIAHDFNNILGIVRGYAEMLQHQGEQVARLSLPIIEASDRASLMISQLLDFSSSKARDVTAIELGQHINALRPLLEKSVASGVVLVLQVPVQAIGVKVELSAFDNLLINMVVNANHAMNGHGTLTIALCLTQVADLPGQLGLADHPYVHIAIADDGCGMSEQIRKRIFEPFFTTKGEQGTGLGLAQAYGMIQRCGGAIRVDSVEGQGSCFHIYLPTVPVPAAAVFAPALVSARQQRVAKAQQTLDASPRQPQPKAAILLVDDEEELLEMHALLLESAGYQVCKAHSGIEALALLQVQPVQLLLSDIMMPQMNGLELARQIKADFPAVKIQLISGFADSSMICDEDSKGWYEQRLAKPVPMTTLLQRVSSLLSLG